MVVLAASGICVGLLKALVMSRSSTKPDSLLELSVQARLIWLGEMATAFRPFGAAG